jgi:hypothetical protein
VQQKLDVLLVRDAADVEHERPIRRQRLRGPKARAVAGLEAMRQSPVGMTCIGVVTPYSSSTARIGSEGAMSAATSRHCERVKARATPARARAASTGT